MSLRKTQEITAQNAGDFEAVDYLLRPEALDPRIRGGLQWFIKSTVRSQQGNIQIDTASQLVQDVESYENNYPLFSGAHRFRYPALPELPEQGVTCTAENTTLSAVANMVFHLRRYGPEVFAAANRQDRKAHEIQWGAEIDEDYEIRIRGGSGAGVFSIDFGLGFIDHDTKHNTYKELWRTGIDTARNEDSVGARFIRTGSGIKPNDERKSRAFERFRKRHGIMPQRLLGLLGLYYMRELQPDYAVALSTEGAVKLSTLKSVENGCDYTGIFKGLGFLSSQDTKWLYIPDFEVGFYEALERANIRARGQATLDSAFVAVNNMKTINAHSYPKRGPLFELGSDASRETLEKELQVHMPPTRRLVR